MIGQPVLRPATWYKQLVRLRPGCGVAGQRGSTATITVVFLSIIVTAMALSFYIGRLAIHKHEVQTGADAIAQSAAQIVQQEGMTRFAPDIRTYEWAWQGNMLTPPPNLPVLLMDYDKNTRLLNISTLVERPINPQVPGLTDPGGLKVRGLSTVSIRQEILEEINRVRPRFVLVLDYSGSMTLNFGQGKTRIEALRSAVQGLMALNLAIDYGLAIFSSNILANVEISQNSQADILAEIGRNANGSTCTNCGLKTARDQFLRAPFQEDDNRFVLLVTDGQWNDGGDPTGTAENLRRAHHAGLITLEIYNAGGVGPSTPWLKSISGPADSGGNDPEYYYSATNPAALQDQFRRILTRILCQAGPIDNPIPQVQPDGSVMIYGYLRNKVDHTEQPVRDSNGNPKANGLLWDPNRHVLRLPYAPDCEAIINGEADLIVRYDPPLLAQ